MSEATINLVSREAVELHFEGVTYGPIAHTEPLAVLLFCLSPERIRCIGNGEKFEAAMARLLAAARQVCSELQDADDERAPSQLLSEVAPAGFDRWVSAALQAVPQARVEAFRQRHLDWLSVKSSGAAVH